MGWYVMMLICLVLFLNFTFIWCIDSVEKTGGGKEYKLGGFRFLFIHTNSIQDQETKKTIKLNTKSVSRLALITNILSYMAIIGFIVFIARGIERECYNYLIVYLAFLAVLFVVIFVRIIFYIHKKKQRNKVVANKDDSEDKNK